MIDRLKMDKFQSLIVVWLVMTGHLTHHLTQSTSTNDQTTTAAYSDDNQLENTIGLDDCGCLTNYEIKISNDATLYTGQLIRCTNVKDFNHLTLIARLSTLAKCSDVEKQFNEIIITKNNFHYFNYTLLQNLNFTIKVDLSHNGIEQIDESSFSGLTSLKYLDLSGNNLKQLDLRLFNGLASLVKLNLTGNRILNIEDFTFKHLNNLAYLDLSSNHIVAIRRNAFTGLIALVQLNLSSNRIQSLEEGVFDSLISTARKIRLSNNQLICDCNLAWLIKAKERYNKNLIGKVMCSPSHHQPRIKLSSVQYEQLVCAKEVHLNEFELNVNVNSRNSSRFTMQTGQRFVFDCRAIDGKQFTSIRFYRNDHLIAESSNYINYLGDQFMNTTSLLGSKDLIEFNKSSISVNNYTMNRIEQKLTIHRLRMKDAGQYQCVIQTAFGNLSRKYELSIRETNSTIYHQLFNRIKVPNFLMIFNSTLLLIAILIYLANFKSIEMNSRLKHIQLHLWAQLLVLINLFYYSSTDHFSTTIKLNCELYGLAIYYLLVSILFTILLGSICLYKQLTKCTTTSLNNSKLSSLDKRNLTNLTSLTNQPYGGQTHRNQPPTAQFGQQQYNDELISEQILMYQRPKAPESCCLQFVRFLFHHHTVRYHALNTSLTVLFVLVFGLFNLDRFKTNSRCFANILLVSNFYIFVPLLLLIIGQFSMLIVVRCAIKRFYILHKKLEQRDAVQCVSLKGGEHVLEQHSTHVQNCMPCFRAGSKLDMYWTSSKHCLAHTINFVFYLLLLCLIVLTVVSQDANIFKSTTASSSYWWLPSATTGSLVESNSTNSVRLNSISIESQNKSLKNDIQANELRAHLDEPNLGNQTAGQSTNVRSTKLKNDYLFDEQVLTSVYLVCTFLLCGHILVHYCLSRKDVLEALKSFLVRTFCLYACDCFKRSRCCNANQSNSSKQLRSDRYANCTLVPSGILNPNLDAQSSLLFEQHSPSKCYYQQPYSYPNKQQPLLFEERDDLYEQTDDAPQLDGLDLIPNTNNVLYKLANGNEQRDGRNVFKNGNSYQDGSQTTVRLLNEQLLSSESNTSTTVTTTGGSTVSNCNFINEPLVTISQTNDVHQPKAAVTSKFRAPINITSNREHIYYETVNANSSNKPNLAYNFIQSTALHDGQGFMKHPKYFDDTFLEGDGTSYSNSAEKAKSDIVVMSRGRKLRKASVNNKPRCIEVKYHQQSPGGHLILSNDNKSPSSANSKLNQHFTFNNQYNDQQLRTATNLPVPSKPMITTRFEREFITNQLKKYGSDNLDKIDYLPPVAKNTNCKSEMNEIMTTVSQPVTFLHNSKANHLPSRRALLKSSTNHHPKEINFGPTTSLSNSYNQNFASSAHYKLKENYNRNIKKSTTLSNRSYLPIQVSRPLLVLGGPSTLNEKMNEQIDEKHDAQLNGQSFDNQLNSSKFSSNHFNNPNGYQIKENLYERIPCKRTEDNKLPNQKTIIEQESDEDNCYDNLDDCFVNLNTNRVFTQPNQTKNSFSNDQITTEFHHHHRNSPALHLSDLRNSSRNSPNFINSPNLTNFTIKSNNSNRSIKSNLSNHSKKSNHSNQLSGNQLSNNLSSDFNNETTTSDLVEKFNFSRSSTSSNDVFIQDNRSSSFNSTDSDKRKKKRNDHLNLILNARNENGQMNNQLLMENLDNISSSE